MHSYRTHISFLSAYSVGSTWGIDALFGVGRLDERSSIMVSGNQACDKA